MGGTSVVTPIIVEHGSFGVLLIALSEIASDDLDLINSFDVG